MKNCEEILHEKGNNMIFVSDDVTIAEAIGVMIENKIGAILVKSGNKVVRDMDRKRSNEEHEN